MPVPRHPQGNEGIYDHHHHHQNNVSKQIRSKKRLLAMLRLWHFPQIPRQHPNMPMQGKTTTKDQLQFDTSNVDMHHLQQLTSTSTRQSCTHLPMSRSHERSIRSSQQNTNSFILIMAHRPHQQQISRLRQTTSYAHLDMHEVLYKTQKRYNHVLRLCPKSNKAIPTRLLRQTTNTATSRLPPY